MTIKLSVVPGVTSAIPRDSPLFAVPGVASASPRLQRKSVLLRYNIPTY